MRAGYVAGNVAQRSHGPATSVSAPADIVIEPPSAVDLDVIHRFLRDSYWSPGIARAVVERACAGSMCAIGRDADRSLVGFARLVTDRATFAWLCDVFVLPAHQ